MRLAWLGSIAVHAALASGLLWLTMDRPVVAQFGSGGAVTIELVDGPAEPTEAGATVSPAQSPTTPRIEPKPVGTTQDNAPSIQLAGSNVTIQPASPEPVQTVPNPSSPPSTPMLTASKPLSATASSSVIVFARDDGGPGAVEMGEAEDAGSTEAAPSGGAVAGEADPWPAYYAAVQAAVQRVQHYPFSARLAGLEDRVKVGFRIVADGSAEQIHVTESSRFPVLNEAAVDTVRRAARFPAPPLRDGQSGVRVTVPLEFTLHHQEEVAPH
jgi:periplasmic protein TonB